jgi:tellurite resistance protein
MIQISTQAIGLLRDRLLESGGPPSVLATGPEAMRAAHPMDGDDEAKRLFEAAFEAMYVMVAADGSVGQEEKDVLRGAIRELTAGAVRTAEIEKMSSECEARLKADGATKRLAASAEALKSEKVAAEAAFVLAAAMAFADSEIADEENEALNSFAELLGIEEERANELLDELEPAT